MLTEKSWDVFISYKRDPDEEAALDLLGALERAGLTCWIAPRDIRATGQMIAARQLSTDGGWDTVIPFAIRGSRAMAVVVSDAAMKGGKQIKKELHIGDNADIKFFPVLIEDAPLRDSFELHLGREQWSNCFSGKGSQRFLNVATDICGFLGVAMRDKPAPSTKSIAPPSVVGDGRSCPDCGGKSPAEANFCNGCGRSFGIGVTTTSFGPGDRIDTSTAMPSIEEAQDKNSRLRFRHADGSVVFLEHRQVWVGYANGKIQCTKSTAEKVIDFLKSKFDIDGRISPNDRDV